MITPLFAFLLGATTFVEQPLPGLQVGTLDITTGLAPVNTRPGDLDGDGATDLLMPTAVLLQRHGVYPINERVMRPEPVRGMPAVVYDAALFALVDGEMTVFTFTNDTLHERKRIRIDPEASSGSVMLHDLTGDDRPEVIVVTPNRAVAHQSGAPYDPVGDLPVFPPKRPRLIPAMNLWNRAPREARRDFEWIHDFTILPDPRGLAVLERIKPDRSRLYYTIARYAFSQDADGTWTLDRDTPRSSGLLPSSALPIFDGARATPQLVSVDEHAVDGPPFQQSILDVGYSGDFGTTWHRVRLKAAPNQFAFVDADGDGDRDVVASHGALFDAPIREVLNALVSDDTITVEITAHLQRADGSLTRTPRRMFETVLDLGGPAIRRGERWERYRTGNLVSATSDVNGDGRADVVAWETPNKIAVYVNEEGEFPREPTAVLRVAVSGGLFPADVDHDGRADIVVLPSPSEHDASPTPIVYFSRE